MKLAVATCQFAVGADIKRNLEYVLQQMKTAKHRGAHVAHFSEACLSGYAGADFDSFEGFDWQLLTYCIRKVMALARQLRLWVILGSSHRLTGKHKPHNSLYVIDNSGRLVDRYDKRFCTGDLSGKTEDLEHYTPGNHFCVFSVRKVRCGLLICHENRYDELCREYRKQGVQVLFYSHHNAGHPRGQRPFYDTVPQAMQTYAANNCVWISNNNSCRPVATRGSFFVQPDGQIIQRLCKHRSGVMINTIDTKAKFYDASEHWRDRALRGIYYSGTLVRDKRSDNRKSL